MSSFMKQGKRKSVNAHNKKRIEEVTKILEELDYLAVELIKYSIKEKKTIDKDDIKELAQELTDMPIGDLEVSILWSKLHDFETRANEQIRKNKDDINKSKLSEPESGDGDSGPGEGKETTDLERQDS